MPLDICEPLNLRASPEFNFEEKTRVETHYVQKIAYLPTQSTKIRNFYKSNKSKQTHNKGYNYINNIRCATMYLPVLAYVEMITQRGNYN